MIVARFTSYIYVVLALIAWFTGDTFVSFAFLIMANIWAAAVFACRNKPNIISRTIRTTWTNKDGGWEREITREF